MYVGDDLSTVEEVTKARQIYGINTDIALNEPGSAQK